jgi:hypothetical protein
MKSRCEQGSHSALPAPLKSAAVAAPPSPA